MMSMGDSEYVAKKLGITRSRVIDIFLNCLKIIAQTINLKKDKEKWEKLEKENQQLKFLTATLRQELEDLKDSKPVEPKKFKTEEELLNDKLNTSIYNFAFSIRAIHVLEGVGCKTLGDVKNLQKGDLRNIPNCGLKTIKDIEEVLEANGLSLKDIES
jgi:DNA-directed RNA polymerase alpha subunit